MQGNSHRDLEENEAGRQKQRKESEERENIKEGDSELKFGEERGGRMSECHARPAVRKMCVCIWKGCKLHPETC